MFTAGNGKSGIMAMPLLYDKPTLLYDQLTLLLLLQPLPSQKFNPP